MKDYAWSEASMACAVLCPLLIDVYDQDPMGRIGVGGGL